MRIWAVANQKGGVGKTTTAVTLGGLLTKLLRDVEAQPATESAPVSPPGNALVSRVPW